MADIAGEAGSFPGNIVAFVGVVVDSLTSYLADPDSDRHSAPFCSRRACVAEADKHLQRCLAVVDLTCYSQTGSEAAFVAVRLNFRYCRYYHRLYQECQTEAVGMNYSKRMWSSEDHYHYLIGTAVVVDEPVAAVAMRAGHCFQYLEAYAKVYQPAAWDRCSIDYLMAVKLGDFVPLLATLSGNQMSPWERVWVASLAADSVCPGDLSPCRCVRLHSNCRCCFGQLIPDAAMAKLARVAAMDLGHVLGCCSVRRAEPDAVMLADADVRQVQD